MLAFLAASAPRIATRGLIGFHGSATITGKIQLRVSSTFNDQLRVAKQKLGI
jgi:hypothetical protein